ncbi:CaiB/BaiF CoA-transferase family protein [Nocardioides sp. YIM 152315]|uniref:CaiB/BaiF CoA transferase family protein n=1 Tax=Nocardioides sp. YIM 152315 TaxID=3031760 RepID=UPI0023DB97CC|nr:CaiB/BaiF CoA-transferase family protein [Nocardioides sp. YIM 152315]MDF1602107.1 CaiB/BaiF CoA-transferase family protein [Nocardioides sp. YIM 152315]
MTATPAGPLAGLRVLELGSFIAGPFAGQLLGDYGADVVKIETTTTGDPMRRWGINVDGESLWWPSIARNKRSVALDLRQQEGRELVRRLITEVDVVLENFRPGTLTGWDLDYEALSALNPRLIMVHVSGFGQTGPRASEAGFGSIGEAMGGIRHTTGNPELPPTRSGISLGDSLAAMFAVIGTLAAVHERHASGRGQEVDVAIYEAVAALMESTMADHAVAGVTRGRTGSVLPGVSPSNVYPTADGAEVLIAANADTVFRRLCAAMGAPELADDPRFADHHARGEHMAEIDGLVADWTRTMTADVLLKSMEESGVPAGRIYTAPDMLADPQYAARDMVVTLVNRFGAALPAAGIVPKFSRTHPAAPVPGPELGSHTRDVLTRLAGVDAAQWERLQAAGVAVQAG